MEFRAMRRKTQELDQESTAEILVRGTSGVLAVAGDDGYPYAVPLSYAYDSAQSRIVFHSAKTGHKIDALLREPKASFCVIDQDVVEPQKFTTFFRSAIAFGRVRIIEDEAEKHNTVRFSNRHYAPAVPQEAEDKEIDAFWNTLLMFELRIEHLTGKEAIELVRARTPRR